MGWIPPCHTVPQASAHAWNQATPVLGVGLRLGGAGFGWPGDAARVVVPYGYVELRAPDGRFEGEQRHLGVQVDVRYDLGDQEARGLDEGRVAGGQQQARDHLAGDLGGFGDVGGAQSVAVGRFRCVDG
ncbi:MAG: hypothetical protein HOY75_22655 [Streptomyces sp.]|nr:hypothetical protein [Streptomyces sp.]